MAGGPAGKPTLQCQMKFEKNNSLQGLHDNLKAGFNSQQLFSPSKDNIISWNC